VSEQGKSTRAGRLPPECFSWLLRESKGDLGARKGFEDLFRPLVGLVPASHTGIPYPLRKITAPANASEALLSLACARSGPAPATVLAPARACSRLPPPARTLQRTLRGPCSRIRLAQCSRCVRACPAFLGPFSQIARKLGDVRIQRKSPLTRLGKNMDRPGDGIPEPESPLPLSPSHFLDSRNGPAKGETRNFGRRTFWSVRGMAATAIAPFRGFRNSRPRPVYSRKSNGLLCHPIRRSHSRLRNPCNNPIEHST
jgi:hypothetical protein